MSTWKLQSSMLGTLAVIFGLSTLFFTILLELMGALNIFTLVTFVFSFNLIQWLLAPYLIDALYRVREVSKSENPKLHSMVESLSQKSGVKAPRVMMANIPIPNAFAYGSPIGGTKVAVTSGLLQTLEDEEVEAVLGHEIGHLKHRDVQVMMFVSMLPAIFLYIYYSMIMSSWYGRGRERDSGSAAVLIGVASFVMYMILSVFTLYLSRLREYFADRHSANIVDEGRRKLSEALAKIQLSTGKMKRTYRGPGTFSSFKALFIADPDKAEIDAASIMQARGYTADQRLVEGVLRRELTGFDRLTEIFSTHPNIVKRLRALQKLS